MFGTGQKLCCYARTAGSGGGSCPAKNREVHVALEPTLCISTRFASVGHWHRRDFTRDARGYQNPLLTAVQTGLIENFVRALDIVRPFVDRDCICFLQHAKPAETGEADRLTVSVCVGEDLLDRLSVGPHDNLLVNVHTFDVPQPQAVAIFNART
jgi:hypothetical protein